MNIGLYFGSFNPVHTGHLIVAQQLFTQAKLDKVWFVLSPQNPLKTNEEMLGEEKRLVLLQKAIAGNNDFEACEVEFNLPRPSYTIDTLYSLANQYPEHTFSILLGSDNLDQFMLWKNYEDILHNYKLLVYARGAIDEKWEQYRNLLLFDVPYLHFSATYIRHLVKEGRSIRYLVPECIEENIKEWYS